MSAPIRWVAQEHDRGCGFAALAMLVGKTYAQVVEELTKPLLPDGFTYIPSAGSPIWQHMDRYLVDHGFAIARRYAEPLIAGDIYPWPPAPWVALHLCNVKVSEAAPCNHWVVMLADGAVLDPLTPEPRRLTDYWRVNNVAAVVEVPTP